MRDAWLSVPWEETYDCSCWYSVVCMHARLSLGHGTNENGAWIAVSQPITFYESPMTTNSLQVPSGPQ